MIGLTREADDALRIVWLLAQTDGILETATLCEQTVITPRFALKILRKLSQGGLVASQRGKNGGYRLTRRPEEYPLGEILALTEGGLEPVACLHCGKDCAKAGHCETLPVWKELNALISNYLNSVTVADLVNGTVPASLTKEVEAVAGAYMEVDDPWSFMDGWMNSDLYLEQLEREGQ